MIKVKTFETVKICHKAVLQSTITHKNLKQEPTNIQAINHNEEKLLFYFCWEVVLNKTDQLLVTTFASMVVSYSSK